MKALMIVFCLGLISMSYAAETTTDCPMMSERNERSNPKANLAVKQQVNKKKNSATAQ